MPREKFGTLTEPMFYILLCLREECCGTDIMGKVSDITGERVKVGPGTLYNLLEQFQKGGLICEMRSEGRRKNYIMTPRGQQTLEHEFERICQQAEDYKRLTGEEKA